MRLVRDDATGRRVGRIVEVEAYIGEDDRASHARFGRTARNAVMWGEPGRAYLYLVYGMHVCLNVVTEPAGGPAAVLIRSVELLEGESIARAARAERTRAVRRSGIRNPRAAWVPRARLASGPGLVGAAFGLATAMTGTDLCDPASALHLEPAPPGEPEPDVRSTARIGIAYAGEPWTSRPWRFVIAGNPSVSGPAGPR